MWIDSKLDKSMWSESVLAATYIINRSPTLILDDKIPSELWTNFRPNISNLRVFGSTAYFHKPKHIRNKFYDKPKKCIIVGYNERGYRHFDVENKKILIGRDVIFNENVKKDRKI